MTRTLHLEEWSGQWVGLDAGGDVIVSAATLDELLSRLQAEGISEVEIMQAPDPSAAISYGLA